MPGRLRQSLGTADLHLCEGKHREGSTALERRASEARRSVAEDRDAPAPNKIDTARWSQDYSEDASPESDELPRETVKEQRVERPVKPATQTNMLAQEENGLPPTPPTLTNSDAARDPARTSQPVSAESVRHALQEQRSGLHTPTANPQTSPLTPDPSPPSRIAEEKPPPMQTSNPPKTMRPALGKKLKQYPSSRAESFRTAREDQPQSYDDNAGQVYIPADDQLPQHWLDSSGLLRPVSPSVDETAVIATPRAGTPVEPKRRSKHASSPPGDMGKDEDWEKHISYVSGADELDVKGLADTLGMEGQATGLGLYDFENKAKPAVEQVAQTQENTTFEAKEDNTRKPEVDGTPQEENGKRRQSSNRLSRSAEDINNLVYKHIREENAKRHSAISNSSGAIAAGIVVPSQDSTPRKLKRQTKCQTLRGDASNDSKRASMDSEHQLRSKKLRLPDRGTLEDSPLFQQPSNRQVSSPARLDTNTVKMTAFTYASMRESPELEDPSSYHPVVHKLRHLSHTDRLVNNMAVRRSSLEPSPLDKEREPIELSKRQHSLRRSPRGEGVKDNIGVKRRSVTESFNTQRVNLEDQRRASSGTPRSPGQHSGLRHFSPEARLQNNKDVLRNKTVRSNNDEARSPSGTLQRSSGKEKLEDSGSIRRASIELPMESPVLRKSLPAQWSLDSSLPPLSPPKSNWDARFLHPSTTPASTSAFSDRSEMEVCEASGVRLYQHNNNSLLLVQQGMGLPEKRMSAPPPTSHPDQMKAPIFAPKVHPPSPTLGANRETNHVDSPLTRPRAAPEPPQFKVTPPTPNDELADGLSDAGRHAAPPGTDSRPPARSLTLLQRARRYSDTLFSRTGSTRRARSQPPHETRATHLSPFWRPQGFWDDFSDSESDPDPDFDEPGDHASSALPRGGDTSDDPASARQNGHKSTGGALFPRQMSKRLPGFRGTGGFLQGNSLGLARHGTNTRRHYVSTSTATLDRFERASKTSAEVRRNWGFAVPFSGGRRAEWVGVGGLRDSWGGMRARREERRRERRREVLKGRIGMRVFHVGG